MKTKTAFGGKTWSDPNDAPRLTRAFFARAEIREGDKGIRPARAAKLRLQPDVVDALRAAGDDWQAAANEVLRAAIKRKGKS